MSDFKDFFDKVLVSIGNDEYQAPAHILLDVARLEPPDPEYKESRDALPPDELKRGYSAVMNHVLDDATKRDRIAHSDKHDALDAFTDVLTELIVDVIRSHGVRGTGAILHRLGAHLERLGAAEEARGRRVEALFGEELARQELIRSQIDREI